MSDTGTVLGREALLGVKDICPSERVEMPEFGGVVVVRGMTGKEFESFNRSIQKKGSKPDQVEIDDEAFNAKLITLCLVDEQGKRILKDEDWEAVKDWPAAVYQRVLHVALRVNGYVDEGNS